MRTLFMLPVAACGIGLGRPGTASVIWLWSLAAVLVWDPWASLSPGMWLSFGAVGLLLYASVGRIARAPPRSSPARSRRALGEGAGPQWMATVGRVPAH